MKKNISISAETWKSLKYLQLEKNYDTLDMVISGLITYYKKGGAK